MLKLYIVAGLLTLCMCAVPHDKISKIFKEFDYNNNDNINENEVRAFYHNLKLRPDDVLIKKATFVKNWGAKFGDSSAVSEKMFDHMDMNSDGLLTEADVPLFYTKFDRNRNGIEWAEFELIFNEWYTQ